MLSMQAVETAQGLMTALATLEAQDNRALAQRALDRAAGVAATLRAEGRPAAEATTAYVLAVFAKHYAGMTNRSADDAYLGVIMAGALAIELGLEPDDAARARAARLVAEARGLQVC